MPQILTANTLGLGDVVYWSATQGWVRRLTDADTLPDESAKSTLKAANEWVERREIVNPYLFAVREEDGQTVPVKAREAIRAAGPTVRRDLGKQASGI